MELRTELQQAIGLNPELELLTLKQKAVVLLYINGELSIKDIAKIMGISAEAVRYHLRQGSQILSEGDEAREPRSYSKWAHWNPWEERYLRQAYGMVGTDEISDVLGKPKSSIYNKVLRMRKSGQILGQ